MTKTARLRAMIFTALIATLILVAIFAPLDHWVTALTRPQAWRGPQGVALFITLYVLWNFALPPAPLQALAGAYYGFFGGLAVVILGTAVANILSHGVGKWLGRDFVVAKIESYPRLAAIERAVEGMGWKGVALLRLSNLIPSNIANLFLGLTSLGLPTILAASLLGSIPGWMLMLTLGRGGTALAGGPGLNSLEAMAYVISGIAAVGLLIGLGWYSRKILRAQSED